MERRLLMSKQYKVNKTTLHEHYDASQSHYQKPTSEMIDASWEKMSRLMDARRRRGVAAGTYPESTNTVLYSLDTDMKSSHFLEASTSVSLQGFSSLK
jgi:hypothetical protein